MKSIKLKLVIIYLALVFIVMIISGTFILMQTRDQELKNAKSQLQAYTRNINAEIIQPIDNPSDFNEALKKMFNPGSNLSLNILNENGITIASSGEIMDYYSSVITSAMTGVPLFSSDKISVDLNGAFLKWVEYGYPISKGEQIYIIFTRIDAGIHERILDSATTITFALILALILTGVLGVLFADTLTGPIVVLTKKSKDLALGKYLNQKIPVNSKDEIGQLTESFNHMASELNNTMENMASEKNKMEILLHNMTDGVLAYSSDGTQIHANYTTTELLSDIDIRKMSFDEIVHKLGLGEIDLHSFTPGSLIEGTINVSDKYISSVLTPYFNKNGETDGVVIVLQDITKHKKLDNMRKEFVANVSHEIRTPLTTIKSYTETLLDGAMEDSEITTEFLTIIDKEADRMALLVKDLLELSRFDNKQFEIRAMEIDLVSLVLQNIKQNELVAKKKNIEITFNDSEQICLILADASRINQVISNIIGNSIKYSPEGAKITISLESSDRYYRLYIKDTGFGIPKEDLLRIFERFYRVDKARSRAMGGTGLGLSIAKEIMEAHGGKISVNSEFGVGTTMILRFKKFLDY